jgi:hypothetical protein
MTAMGTDPQASFGAIPSTLAVVPANHALARSSEQERRGMFGRLAHLWRRQPARAAPGLEQLSASTLHAELRTIDEGIASAMRNLAALETGEQEALARRDKLALDVAWQGREVETAKIEELGHRREHVYKALLERFVPEVSAWNGRCEAAVSRWESEDRQQVSRIEQILREVETLVWSLTTRETSRATERHALLDEFDRLHQKAGAIPLSQPEIDWNVPPVSLHDVSVRLESIHELLRRSESELPVSAG